MTTRDKVKSSKRILAVQTQLVKLAEWKLNLIQRKTVELHEDQQRLQAFVSQSDNLSPLMSAAAFKRGKQLQTALVQTKSAAVKQETHKDTMKRREKLAEGLVDKAKSAAAQEEEKRQLQEIIEAANWPGDASFP